MTGIEIFTLIFLGVLVVAGIAHQVTKNHSSLKDMVQDVKDIEVQAEELAKELYNKDLRPIVAKKAAKEDKAEEVEKETKPEFPIDKPKRKRKYYPKKK
jgi:hypothetical protein